MTCPRCADNACEECVDVLLILANRDTICTCGRELHEQRVYGEPIHKQVKDPITGDVHGPGMIARADGEVEYHGTGDQV